MGTEISNAGNGIPAPQGAQTPGLTPNKLGGVLPTPDGDASLDEISKQLADEKAKREKLDNDINQLKSSFDKRLQADRQEWADKYNAIQEERDALIKQGLDEQGQLEYDLKRANELREQAERDAQQYKLQMERQQQETADFYGWYNEFSRWGIPDDQLDKTSLDSLYQSGMAYVAQFMQGQAMPPGAPQQRVHTTTGTSQTAVDYWTFVKENYGGNEEAMWSDPAFDPTQHFPGLQG